MNWVDSKLCECCQAEGTEKHRLYRCGDWKEEAIKVPDVARSCEMKEKVSNKRLEMAEGVGVVSKVGQRRAGSFGSSCGSQTPHGVGTEE